MFRKIVMYINSFKCMEKKNLSYKRGIAPLFVNSKKKIEQTFKALCAHVCSAYICK